MADKELARLNGSAKGYRNAFVLIRNRLTQALPLHREGPTLSWQSTIDNGLNKLGPAADKVHDTYQRLLDLDTDERHHTNYKERQDVTDKEYKNLSNMADDVLGHVEGQQVQQQQQQQPLAQADIVAATMAAMQAANSRQGVHYLRAEDMEQPDDLLLGRTADGHQSRTSPMGQLLQLHAH
jgi:hypothetical protein